jgi:hypothetical protein
MFATNSFRVVRSVLAIAVPGPQATYRLKDVLPIGDTSAHEYDVHEPQLKIELTDTANAQYSGLSWTVGVDCQKASAPQLQFNHPAGCAFLTSTDIGL